MLSVLGLFVLVPLIAGNFQPAFFANVSSERSMLTINRILDDGEFQRVTKWPGFCVAETTVDWGDIDVTLREVWTDDTSLKLQLIYAGGILNDCVEETYDEIRAKTGGSTDCLSQLLPEDDITRGTDHLSSNDSALVTSSSTPRHLSSWFTRTDYLRRECYRVKNQARNQIIDRQEKSRLKRGVQEMMFAPGTKWCGPQQLALTYADLGGLDQLDRCCRRHDHCHRAIPPFTQRYGYFNYMPFTLSHCGCDQSFRTCLKMAGTASAKFVGKLFFNMVQTKCFVLKREKACTKRSWYGKCERFQYRKQAYIRSNVPY